MSLNCVEIEESRESPKTVLEHIFFMNTTCMPQIVSQRDQQPLLPQLQLASAARNWRYLLCKWPSNIYSSCWSEWGTKNHPDQTFHNFRSISDFSTVLKYFEALKLQNDRSGRFIKEARGCPIVIIIMMATVMRWDRVLTSYVYEQPCNLAFSCP